VAVNGKAHQLAVQRLELWLHGGEGHEFGGADWREVRRVAEQDDPLALVIFWEVDGTLRGVRLEGGCGFADQRNARGGGGFRNCGCCCHILVCWLRLNQGGCFSAVFVPMVVVVMAVFVAIVVIMIVPVVRATLRLPGQLAVQVCRNQGFDRLVRRPCHHVDALLSKERQRSLADAPSDDNLNPKAVKPPRKRARLMFGRRQRFGTQNGFGVGVHFHNGEFVTAAEVAIKTSVFNRNGNFHSFVCFVIFR